MRWRRGDTNESRSLALHVGTPKSATTYLQAVLSASRPELRRRGALYPGADYLPAGGLNQQPAVYALAGAEVRWISDAVRQRGSTLMTPLAEELRKHRGHAVVSAEALASFSADSGRAVVEALGYQPEQVRVVITARDLGRLMTSVWQENVKNGATSALDDYLDSVAQLRGAGDSPFWNAYGLPTLVDRWAEVVGLQRVHLVTVPQADRREELWPRFCRAIDLADLPMPQARPQQKQNNISLTPSQVELLRQLNVVLESEQLTHDERQRLRGRLLDAWMASPSSRSRQLELSSSLADALTEWTGQDVDALQSRAEAGLTVEGHLDELTPQPRIAGADDAAAPGLLDAARDLLALLRDPQPTDASPSPSR